MATALLRPDADVSNAWTVTDGGSTTAWQVTDDAVTQPTAPGTASDFIRATTQVASTVTFEAGVGTVPIVEVQSAQVWLYTGATGVVVANCTYSLFKGSTSLASVTQAVDAAAGWISATYTGALTQAEVDDLRIKGVTSAGTSGSWTVYAAYVELTYTPKAAPTIRPVTFAARQRLATR